MTVVYSLGSKFAGGGIGNPAYHQVAGLERSGALHRLLCGSFQPTDIPRAKIKSLGLPSRAMRKLATFDSSGWIWYLHNVAYDAWAARLLVQASSMQVWSGHGLRSLLRAKEMGMMTIVNYASSHPIHQLAILRKEYRIWALEYKPPRPTIDRALAELDRADYVLIPSKFVRQSFLAQGFSDDRLILVPFGVDTTRFHPVENRRTRRFRVLFVGQVGVRKGVPYLLEAWRKLDWQDAELWIVGPVQPRFRRVLTRWKELSGVRFSSYAPDPVRLFQKADVFAFPTIEEGSALVTYEALACGLPVLTTPNAGSVVRESAEGYVLPIRDVDGLTERLDYLRRNDAARRKMGEAARRRAEDFTWDRHAEAAASAVSRAEL